METFFLGRTTELMEKNKRIFVRDRRDISIN